MCGRACLTNFIAVDVAVVDEYVQKWGLNKDEKREILRLLHVALHNDSRPDAAAEVDYFNIKLYLLIYSNF